MSDFLILGSGYTAGRVARSLVKSGNNNIVCTNRQAIEIPGARCIALDIRNPASVHELRAYLSDGVTVLHSIPTSEGTTMLLDALRPFHPSRIVYLSTTGVYGAAEFVDERTTPSPNTERDTERLKTEQLLADGPWSSLVLRPAAIYGPGRGVHTSAHAGLFRPPPGGDRIVSRIHVEDLADHVLAGLRVDISGAFPIADEEPCPSSTVAEFAFATVGVPFATGPREGTSRDERKAGRRVDGSACRRVLGLSLRYPSYREGVPACLQAERAEASN